jgi:hypothetical protein
MQPFLRDRHRGQAQRDGDAAAQFPHYSQSNLLFLFCGRTMHPAPLASQPKT